MYSEMLSKKEKNRCCKRIKKLNEISKGERKNGNDSSILVNIFCYWNSCK